MTMNMSELRERVIQQYPQFEQIDDSVLCFTRKQENQPFAVYYIDIASDLPSTKESLNQYQDRLIGKRYFDGRKSLQWSNYFYFLRSEEELARNEVKQAKELIESDRAYARKFVIPEHEIDSVLVPHIVSPSQDAQRESVLSVWIELLTEAGLDQAILSDASLPTRLRYIESNTKKERTDSASITRKTVKPAQYLTSLTLSQYRSFPLKRHFDFGTVNLIFGSNASGKTSLLEAIELFYCGRNKRNLDQKPNYRLDAILADGTTERATSQRDLSVFRDKNLSWYGQSEVRTNNLYKSFAQFNFLDTDAAVSLSESTEHIEEDLSKLLVGPDTSKIWRDIERVDDEVKSKLKELRPYKKQIEAELSRLTKLLDDLANERQLSDIILDRLSKMLERYNWKQIKDEPELFLESLNGSLTELLSVAQQAKELKWTESPTTHAALDKFVQESSRLLDDIEPKLHRIEELQKEIYSANVTVDQLKHAHKLVDEVNRYIDSGFLELTSKHANTKITIELCSKLLRSYDDQFIAILSDVDADCDVASSLKSASEERLKAEAELATTKDEYSKFAKLSEDSIKLSQQLRQIAGTLIQRAKNPDQCPLCHTQFASGDLAKHMNFGVDTQLEALGQSLLSRMRESESLLKNNQNMETALTWLNQFCQKSLEGVNYKLQEALDHLRRVQNELAAAHEAQYIIDKEMVQLTDSGFSAEQFENLLSELNTMGYKIENLRKEVAVQLLSQIDTNVSSQSKNIEKSTKELDEVEADLKKLLNLSGNDPDFEGAISILREKISATDIIIARLSEFSGEFGWPHDRPISDLIATADGVRKVASEAYNAIVHERRVSSQQSDGLKRQEGLKEQLEKLENRIKHFNQAHTVFNKIRNNHSLNQAMEASLHLNRGAIESIFSTIHSPAEFSGLGPTLATLVRKVDDSTAKLTEISTGQRAAFGLSVFLAQNSQLTAAPPVILIDDPIAHVDDLNSLSFLDYLREISLTGKRQIFFATANDKLATLFERKFDFLGEDQFKRFNLSREAG